MKIIVLLLLMLTSSAATHAVELKAGVAGVEITPSAFMNGMVNVR